MNARQMAEYLISQGHDPRKFRIGIAGQTGATVEEVDRILDGLMIPSADNLKATYESKVYGSYASNPASDHDQDRADARAVGGRASSTDEARKERAERIKESIRKDIDSEFDTPKARQSSRAQMADAIMAVLDKIEDPQWFIDNRNFDMNRYTKLNDGNWDYSRLNRDYPEIASNLAGRAITDETRKTREGMTIRVGDYRYALDGPSLRRGVVVNEPQIGEGPNAVKWEGGGTNSNMGMTLEEAEAKLQERTQGREQDRQYQAARHKDQVGRLDAAMQASPKSKILQSFKAQLTPRTLLSTKQMAVVDRIRTQEPYKPPKKGEVRTIRRGGEQIVQFYVPKVGWVDESEIHEYAHEHESATRPEPATKAKPQDAIPHDKAMKLIAQVQAGRTPEARAADKALKAQRVVPVKQAHIWAKAPHRYDIRGVDTPCAREKPLIPGVAYTDKGRERLTRKPRRGWKRVRFD